MGEMTKNHTCFSKMDLDELPVANGKYKQQ